MIEKTETEQIFIALLLFIMFLLYVFGFTGYSNIYLFSLCVIGMISGLYGLFKANVQNRNLC